MTSYNFFNVNFNFFTVFVPMWYWGSNQGPEHAELHPQPYFFILESEPTISLIILPFAGLLLFYVNLIILNNLVHTPPLSPTGSTAGIFSTILLLLKLPF